MIEETQTSQQSPTLDYLEINAPPSAEGNKNEFFRTANALGSERREPRFLRFPSARLPELGAHLPHLVNLATDLVTAFIAYLGIRVLQTWSTRTIVGGIFMFAFRTASAADALLPAVKGIPTQLTYAVSTKIV